MSSYVARVIGLIKDEFTVALGGISPPPVPARATYPYVTVTQIMTTEVESHSEDSGLTRSLIQINCFDKNYEAAWTAREAIKTLLRLSVPANDVKLSGINHNQDNELFDGNTSLHQLVVRYFMWWDSSERVSAI